jgi:hypothetical protein
MTVFTDEEARRQLDNVLSQARNEGEVRIRAGDGQEYVVRPAPTGKSPLDVGTVDLNVSAADIVRAVREGRQRAD